MSGRIYRRLAAALVGLVAGVHGAHAQSIKLKLAHPLPATHYAYEQGIKKFIDAVAEQSNNTVAFEVYPSNQLGKDALSLLKSGLADIAMIVPSYVGDKFPLSSVTELPGLYTTSCEATNKAWTVAKPGALIDQDEYKPLGIRVLLLNTLPGYVVATSGKKVEKLDDVSGLKLFANGPAMDKTVRALGGVPVHMGASELYDSMTRGTVDGAVFPYPSLAAYKIDKNIKFSTEGAQLGSATWIVAISEKSWAKLPESVRAIMTSKGPAMQNELCSWIDADNGKVRDRMVKEQGTVLTALPADQVKLWTEKLSVVGTQWAKEMDGAGKRGTELLNAIRAAPPK